VSPFFFANWSQINRAFCALCWMAALALAVVIVGLAANASSVGTLDRSAQRAPAVGASVVLAHRYR
jgi:hypothetical protein